MFSGLNYMRTIYMTKKLILFIILLGSGFNFQKLDLVTPSLEELKVSKEKEMGAKDSQTKDSLAPGG